jgi:hypothetical protein
LERKKEEKGGKKGNDKKGGAPGKGADDWDKTEVTVPMTKVRCNRFLLGRSWPQHLLILNWYYYNTYIDCGRY